MAEPGSRRFRLALTLLFAGAMAVRVFGLTWDQGHSFHPDERRIVEAVQHLSFSPLQLDPKFYAYGSLPFYVTRAACSLLGNASAWFLSWDGILLTGRVLSAAWGSLGCVLLALLGRRLFGERAGLLAGALLAGAVFHVQNSHFATNDVPLTTLVLATFLLLARALDRGHWFRPRLFPRHRPWRRLSVYRRYPAPGRKCGHHRRRSRCPPTSPGNCC